MRSNIACILEAQFFEGKKNIVQALYSISLVFV